MVRRISPDKERLAAILRRIPWSCGRTLFALLAVGFASCQQVPPPAPEMPPLDRLSGPDLPATPGQADRGAMVYWQVCMACHGDRGQGLTETWRASWGPEDMNCWQSKCHAANHPPWGFELPANSPAVIGPEALTRSRHALELYQLIAETMPWWNPGSLNEEDAWAVTAYLLKANASLPANVILNPKNAAAFPVHPGKPPPGDIRPQAIILAVLLGLAAVGLAIEFWFYRA